MFQFVYGIADIRVEKFSIHLAFGRDLESPILFLLAFEISEEMLEWRIVAEIAVVEELGNVVLMTCDELTPVISFGYSCFHNYSV